MVAKSQTRLSDFTLTFHFHALEKEMATHSSVLAWRIPGTGEPDGLASMGWQSRTRLKQLSSSSSNRLRLKALATLIFYYCTVIFGRKEVKLKHHRYVTMCLYIIRISPLILEDGFLTEQFSSIHRRVLKMGFT